MALAVGEAQNIVQIAQFSTSTPDATLAACKHWLNQHKFDTLEICSFGPLDLIIRLRVFVTALFGGSYDLITESSYASDTFPDGLILGSRGTSVPL